MITTVTIGGRGPDGSQRTSQTVACDRCGDSLDPGERIADDPPWNDAEAISAAECCGWLIDIYEAGLDECASCAKARLA